MSAEVQVTRADRGESASHDAVRRRMPIRYWIMAAILAAFWIFEFSIYSVEIAMFLRFISRINFSLPASWR
jgi:hypothetical protein